MVGVKTLPKQKFSIHNSIDGRTRVAKAKLRSKQGHKESVSVHAKKCEANQQSMFGRKDPLLCNMVG